MFGVPGCCPCDPPIPCCVRVLATHCAGRALSEVDVTITRTSDSVVVLTGTTDCSGYVVATPGGPPLTFCETADTEYSITFSYWSSAKLDTKWGGASGTIVTSPYTFTWVFHPCVTFINLYFLMKA